MNSQITSIKSESVRDASRAEWQDAWASDPTSTFYQSPQWHEVWAKYSRGRLSPSPLHVELVDQTNVIVPISLEKTRFGRFKTAWLSPGCTYGGWLTSKELDQSHAELLTQFICDRFPGLFWRLNPLNENAIEAMPQSEQDEFTQALDLREGFEGIERLWKSKGDAIRRKARRATSKGVTICCASESDWEGYIEAYQDSLRRWGEKASSVFGRHMFDLLRDTNTDDVQLWVAKLEGRVIAGAIVLYASHHASYWHGAALESHLDRRPANLLHVEIIRDACTRGIKWYDFNPSGGHAGVVGFKNSFGCQIMPSPVVTRKAASSKPLQALKRALT
ncbi:MAG: GNAT family N-acetyltransferase [Planctomycetota bacterium]|nr:GNAT family N-acetyltransferase [Planctomycetota bacterium]